MDGRSFQAISDLAYRESGLQLVPEKASMIQSRLRSRLRALGLSDFSSYADFVCSDGGGEERKNMISALTTNVSHFFRENHHFEFLSEQIIPILAKKLKSGERVRLWSAGCSNGQEACSIAMCLLEGMQGIDTADIRILGTDIDQKVVAFANAARYPEQMVEGIPKQLVEKYFDRHSSNGDVSFVARPQLRKLVRFRELNLLSQWPMRHQMDAIFCRNVVIYFDQETQNKLWPRFRKQLSEHGYLFLGHSERIADPEAAGFHTAGPTTYRPSSQFETAVN